MASTGFIFDPDWPVVLDIILEIDVGVFFIDLSCIRDILDLFNIYSILQKYNENYQSYLETIMGLAKVILPFDTNSTSTGLKLSIFAVRGFCKTKNFSCGKI